MDYEKLLTKARKSLPDLVSIRERFEIPGIRGHLQGNRTMISNFSQVCTTLRRDQAHLLKYLLKELATSGEIKNGRLIFNRKLSSLAINNKVRQYANVFVFCSECGKPDTKLITEKNISFLKCQACGAKHHIKH